MEIIQAITRCINAKWNENTEGVFVFEITECKSCLFFHILLLLLSQSLNIPLDLIFVSFVSSLILLSSFQFDLIEFIYDTIGYFVDIWCQFTQVFFQFTSNFFSPILLIFQIFMRIYWNSKNERSYSPFANSSTDSNRPWSTLFFDESQSKGAANPWSTLRLLLLRKDKLRLEW